MVRIGRYMAYRPTHWIMYNNKIVIFRVSTLCRKLLPFLQFCLVFNVDLSMPGLDTGKTGNCQGRQKLGGARMSFNQCDHSLGFFPKSWDFGVDLGFGDFT